MDWIRRIVKTSIEPEDKDVFWLDISVPNCAVLKYYENGEWKIVKHSKDGNPYILPVDGIPYSDLSQDVKDRIDLAKEQSDWNQNNESAVDYIKNKPNVVAKADKVEGATAGNLASLDEEGNIADSGISKDFIEDNYQHLYHCTLQEVLNPKDGDICIVPVSYNNIPNTTLYDVVPESAYVYIAKSWVKLSGIEEGMSLAMSAYQKPSGGIPKTDMASGVQNSLDLADSALQATPVGQVTPEVNPYDYATRAELEELGQELNGESFEESVSFNLTSGQSIEMTSPVHSMQLIAGKVYKVTYSNNRANGTTFNMYLRTQEDGAVQFKNSDNPDGIASKTAQNSANVTSTILERYISPVSNSDRVMIYAASTSVKDTIVLGITFTLLSDGGLVKDVSDLEEAVEAITPIVPVVTENKNKISALPENDIFDFDDFVVGNNWHGIFVPGEAYRISMKETHIANKDLYLKADDGFRLIVNLFTNGSYIGDSGTTTQYVIKKGVEYLLVIRRATENTSEVATLEEFVPKVKFPTDFYSDFKGAGLLEYYGIKISSLSLLKKSSLCSEEILVSENQGSSDNYMTSGMVVYNGKAFCFTDNMDGVSYCCVFDLATKAQIYKATLPWAAHNNNAQPTPFFYSSDDAYPLFMVSYGNYAGGVQKFIFVRVTEASGVYTFTVVKEVSYSDFIGAQYNASWFANYETNELYCYTYQNGSWSVNNNNPIIIHKFDLPSLDNYDAVSLTGADIKETITLRDHWITQSALCHNGKIFMQVEADGSWASVTINGEPYDFSAGRHLLFIIDLGSGYIETIVPLHGDIEQEGLSIYDGALYMSEKFTTAAQGNVCFRLVKYSF